MGLPNLPSNWLVVALDQRLRSLSLCSCLVARLPRCASSLWARATRAGGVRAAAAQQQSPSSRHLLRSSVSGSAAAMQPCTPEPAPCWQCCAAAGMQPVRNVLLLQSMSPEPAPCLDGRFMLDFYMYDFWPHRVLGLEHTCQLAYNWQAGLVPFCSSSICILGLGDPKLHPHPPLIAGSLCCVQVGGSVLLLHDGFLLLSAP
jgi:hypothetical protein